MHRKAKKPAWAAKSKAGRGMRPATPRTKKRGPAGKSKARYLSVSAPLEPGAPSDLDLMQAIQADDLLQEIFMEIWNQAKNFSAQKGKPLGWMVTLARRRAIDGLRKKQAYTRAEERLQNETEQQPDAWVHNATEEAIVLSDTRVLIRKVISGLP